LLLVFIGKTIFFLWNKLILPFTTEKTQGIMITAIVASVLFANLMFIIFMDNGFATLLKCLMFFACIFIVGTLFFSGMLYLCGHLATISFVKTTLLYLKSVKGKVCFLVEPPDSFIEEKKDSEKS
jgi:hypothetical protein